MKELKQRITWWLLFHAVRQWGDLYLDQFDMFQFPTAYGPVYVNIGRSTPWPDAFDEVDRHGRPIPRRPIPRP